jgi:peptide deformylase
MDTSNLPPIVQAGAPVLRRVASPVPTEEIPTPETQALISTMVAVMRAAPGVGLAAPQIGVGLQVMVIEDREEYMAKAPPEVLAAQERFPVPLKVIINPRLKPVSEEPTVVFTESCLSVSGYMADVKRYREVVVEGFDADGKSLRWQAKGWPARILQHEMDHLQGKLYIDRMDPVTFRDASAAP